MAFDFLSNSFFSMTAAPPNDITSSPTATLEFMNPSIVLLSGGASTKVFKPQQAAQANALVDSDNMNTIMARATRKFLFIVNASCFSYVKEGFLHIV